MLLHEVQPAWNFNSYRSALFQRKTCFLTYEINSLCKSIVFTRSQISFIISVSPSVHPPACNNSAPTGQMYWNLIFENFSKIIPENSISFKYQKYKGHFTRRSMHIYVNISLRSSYNEMFQTKFLELIKTHFTFKIFFSKIVQFMR